MAATEIDVCNHALASLNLDPITAYADNRVEAQRLGAIFADSRDELLRKHAWSFATVREALETTEDAGQEDTIDDYPGDYLFVYVHPPQCLRVVKIVNPANPDVGLPFQILLNPAPPNPAPPPATLDPVKRILTMHEDAIAEYVYRMTNVTLWDSHFVRAMAAYLAFKLIPLRGKEELRRWAHQLYLESLREAGVIDATEQNRPVAYRECRYRDVRR